VETFRHFYYGFYTFINTRLRWRGAAEFTDSILKEGAPAGSLHQHAEGRQSDYAYPLYCGPVSTWRRPAVPGPGRPDDTG